MFSLLDLCFVLCSLDLDVLRVQRIIGFFIIFITHKSTKSEECHALGEAHAKLSFVRRGRCLGCRP